MTAKETSATVGKGHYPSSLPTRPTLDEPGAGIFGAQSWQPPLAAKAPPTAPSAPPMPYRFAGMLVQDGESQIFLSNGNTVIPIKEGEVLDGTYRIESIGENSITLVYLPLQQKQDLAVTSAFRTADSNSPAVTPPASNAPADKSKAGLGTVPSASVIGAAAGDAADPGKQAGAVTVTGNKSARIQWQGPRQVKLGSLFEVVLKVTSSQPLHASPMQLRFDPDYLEFVGVKPGKIFTGSDRNFSYRANPDGSIFVGASSQNPLPVFDTELLVLTFQPVKTSPATQLSVSSLSLQGPAGRPIAVSRLEAFRTAIHP